MRLAILTIGDEICMGQVVNTNSAWMAYECSKLGIDAAVHSTVGDEETAMIAEMERLLKGNDVLLITGGLGPTHDDITKPVLAKFFGDELVLHQPTMDTLAERYLKRGIKFNEQNRSMALLPSRCRVLPNSSGAAPGMLFEENGRIVVSMPGVPAEVKAIMTDHVLPYLKEKLVETGSPVKVFKTLQTIGIAESILAEQIGDVNTFLGNSTLAFLPSNRGVRLRVNSTGANPAEAEAELKRVIDIIIARADKYIYGTEDDAIAGVVGRMMKERGLTISVAESCTGGMLGAALTDIAGSSAYFTGGAITYSNEAKTGVLGVDAGTIANYGAVSRETALEMASCARKKFKTDIGMAITGIAGPDGGTEDKPVGTVWIALANEKEAVAEKFVFGGKRPINRELSVGFALNMLFRALKGE